MAGKVSGKREKKGHRCWALDLGVVNIGTRAIISIDGKPMLATHWDGHPTSLGRDLLCCDKSVKAVIEVAKAHTIDAADAQILDVLNRERVSQLAERHQLSVDEIKAGKRRGNVVSADDCEIADIGLHRDLAEFEYDIRDNAVFFRPLDGWWPESLKRAEEFKRLTARAVAASQAK
jgi:hypothetical protein